MTTPLKLSDEERQAIDRMRIRLLEQGLRVSDEKFVLAILKAATKLPEGELMALIREGLSGITPTNDPTPQHVGAKITTDPPKPRRREARRNIK